MQSARWPHTAPPNARGPASASKRLGGARAHWLGLVEIDHRETVGKRVVSGRGRCLMQQRHPPRENEHTAQAGVPRLSCAWLRTKVAVSSQGAVRKTDADPTVSTSTTNLRSGSAPTRRAPAAAGPLTAVWLARDPAPRRVCSARALGRARAGAGDGLLQPLEPRQRNPLFRGGFSSGFRNANVGPRGVAKKAVHLYKVVW